MNALFSRLWGTFVCHVIMVLTYICIYVYVHPHLYGRWSLPDERRWVKWECAKHLRKYLEVKRSFKQTSTLLSLFSVSLPYTHAHAHAHTYTHIHIHTHSSEVLGNPSSSHHQLWVSSWHRCKQVHQLLPWWELWCHPSSQLRLHLVSYVGQLQGHSVWHTVLHGWATHSVQLI